MKKNLLLLLFMAIGVGYSVAETKLRIEYLDGSELTTALSAIGRWEFTDGKFLLVSASGEVLAEKPNVYDVRRVVFRTEQISVSTEDATTQLAVYPNPTQDVVCIDGLTEGEVVRIYSLEGRLLISQKAQTNGFLSCNIESLAEGTYLLQIGSEIVKIIKQ